MSPGVSLGASMAPCPHCRSQATAEASRSMRWICAVCGGPLVPSASGEPRSGAELATLVSAQRARGISIGWTAASVVLGASAAMALGVALLVWHVAAGAAGIVAALGLTAALLTALCFGRARRANRERAAKLDAAWESVAGEILRARRGAMTATELARTLFTDEAHAETLLALLSAEGRARVAVTEQSDLSYDSVERAADASDEADRALSAESEPRSRES